MKTITKHFVFCVIFLATCAFSPVDVVFKNLKLIPDPIDKADKYPHLPKNYTNAKSEKLWKQPKLPTIKSDKPDRFWQTIISNIMSGKSSKYYKIAKVEAPTSIIEIMA